MGIILFIVIEITYIDWYNPNCTEFPTLNEFINFDFSSRARSVNVGEIVLLENRNHKFAALKITKVVRRNEDINHLD